MNALLHEIVAATAGSTRTTSTRTRWASTSCEQAVARVPAGARRRDLRRPTAEIAAGGRAAGHRRAAAVDRAAGLLPVPPGDRAAVPGQQHPPGARACSGRPGCGVLQMNGQPTAQNTRESGANGDLPGFRNWANDAHVARAGADLERRRHRRSRTRRRRRTRCRSSATRAGLDPLPVDQRHQPGGVAARAGPDPLDPGPGAAVRRRAGHLPDRDRGARRRRAARRDLGREDRDVHQRRPHRAPLREGGRSARPGARDLDIFLDYARRMDFRDKDGRPLVSWQDPESAFAAWSVPAGRPCDYTGLTYDELRAGSASSGRRQRAAVRRRQVSWAHPDDCETYGKRPAHRGADRADRVPGAQPRRQGDAARPPSTSRPTSRRRGLPAAADHRPHDVPLPHPHQDRRAPQLQAAAPDVWVELSPADATRSASRRATWSTSAARAERFAPRRGSAASVTASSSCRFTTATGTPQTGSARPGGQRADADRLGPGLQAADLQDRGGAVTKVADGTGPAPAPIQAAARPTWRAARAPSASRQACAAHSVKRMTRSRTCLRRAQTRRTPRRRPRRAAHEPHARAQARRGHPRLGRPGRPPWRLARRCEPDGERPAGPCPAPREDLADARLAPAAGALLLADLRRFLARASDASVSCVILAQGAQAAQDTDLLSV